MLKSALLSGNPRLQQASNAPPSIRKRPPDDNNDAVQRIQKALNELGFNLPKSFKQGPNVDPDGLYGPETESAVREFQKEEFPNQMGQWDGRCGPNTLGKLDARIVKGQSNKPKGEIECVPAGRGSSPSYCLVKAPTPSFVPIPYPNFGNVAGKRPQNRARVHASRNRKGLTR